MLLSVRLQKLMSRSQLSSAVALFFFVAALLPSSVLADPDYEDHDREIAILFMFGGMSLGVAVTHLMARFPLNLPYTVVIFLIGCVFASLYTNENMGHVGQALDDWSKLDPELMLYMFLPVLIFGEAMTLKWYDLWCLTF